MSSLGRLAQQLPSALNATGRAAAPIMLKD
ncbi:Hypothetical protein tig002_2323a [Mycobacterium tuberculosis]|nr:Hypothetical protein tig002_2323a [Mycobacterium tuberculosis]